MKYTKTHTLMHKNIPVAKVELIPDTGHIVKASHVEAPSHLPVGVQVEDDALRKTLDNWWMSRCIPFERIGLRDTLFMFRPGSAARLLAGCYGLSLSDQYWMRPKGVKLSWENINFFHNGFAKDMGEILFGNEPPDPDRVNLLSPDITTDGRLRKRWGIHGGKPLLKKGDSGYFRQEPFNEVVACALMRRLGVEHVAYTLTMDGDAPYSLCENFITPDTELVPAWRIFLTQRQPDGRGLRDHFLDCCKTLGIPGAKDALDKMLVVDYIIANEDRHWNNFGAVRKAETLEWQGLAPVFDSGTSLWFNRPHVGMRVESKPFSKTHAEQIKLVEDLDWFDAGALKGLDEEIVDIFSASSEVDEARRAAIAKAVMERAGQVEQLRHERKASME